ncbi:pentapeptide repeat-containing protein [Streptomyces sennicomposti]|uniref:pentapeptide repeat-containing protein n=1 Tax=Streptomyces sennicomposti TaxID=2873384 RepID=UPI001CA78213|nr:pentapeptide repeat-containing protein [Streptomyces sennicomposti]MBY8866275.1 pentapeptide repeat-containing protein [Streptomyces sennicomposti]
MKSKARQTILAVVLALGVVGFALLLWRGPWWIDGSHLRKKDLQPADGVVITGFRTMLVAVGAGVIAGLGLYYTHKNHQHTEKLFTHTREKDREQAEITREGQVTERYVEAIKLLSSDNLTQRLGGIYSLERIMHDSERDHALVIEVLAAFIRDLSFQDLVNAEAQNAAYSAYRHGAIRDDLQAALTVLGRRPARKEPFDIDLRGVRLPRVNLTRANLSAADLRDADLSGALLYEANLAGAELEGANLKGAQMAGAQMREALLIRADLTNADLSMASLHSTQLYGAVLTSALLSGADLSGADFARADMRGANLSGAHINGAHFVEANLDRAYLMHVRDGSDGMFVAAHLTSTTTLPDRLSNSPIIVERIRECESRVSKSSQLGTPKMDPSTKEVPKN